MDPEALQAVLLRYFERMTGVVESHEAYAVVEKIERAVAPVEVGQAEVLDWGDDVIFVAYGTLLSGFLADGTFIIADRKKTDDPKTDRYALVGIPPEK